MTTETIPPEEAARIIKAGRLFPEWWMNLILNARLTPKQELVAQSVAKNPRTTVRAAEAVGKSYLAARIGLWFQNHYQPSTVIDTAPTWRQVEEVYWREWAVAFSTARRPLPGHTTKGMHQIDDKWFAIGVSTNEPDRFRGFHNEHVLVIVDEASGVPQSVYDAIENPLAAGLTRLLLIGNPTSPVGPFRESFSSSIYNPIHISAFDSPNLVAFGITLDDIRSGEWMAKAKITDDSLADGTWIKQMPFPSLVAPPRVAERLQEWGEGSLMWESLIMGNFPDSGQNNLIPLNQIESAIERDLAAEGDAIAGLDIARYGESETVWTLRQGDKVLDIQAWSHKDILFTKGRVNSLFWKAAPRILNIDASGIGQDDADLLKAEGLNINAVLVGQPAINSERFGNRRAEYYFQLARRFAEGTISIPNNRKLVAQLADLRVTYGRTTNKVLIESKDEMRARGSKSPDFADSLMLAFIPSGRRGKATQRTY
ncbi:hypothetical protein LCGC14_0514030 [marine sediment metagenome]|uniref:Terminase large subunit gp17-like C-terminal domain-containing protein n=1 Tax=marine sediment metagenome TaxID=412755 RepID=A0A0F9UM64_9ZZZZ